MSFASQKNDMLLRNMIYRLNVDMIGSTSSNMICLSATNVVVTDRQMRRWRCSICVEGLHLRGKQWPSAKCRIKNAECRISIVSLRKMFRMTIGTISKVKSEE